MQSQRDMNNSLSNVIQVQFIEKIVMTVEDEAHMKAIPKIRYKWALNQAFI